MYKAEFDKLLQSNEINYKKNFILFGEGVFFIDFYTKILTQIPDANKLILYFDEYNFQIAKQHLSQASLFGGINLLVLKTDKKIPKKELESLFELTNKGENRFIYAYYGKDHKSYNNAFKKYDVLSVRFFSPKKQEAIVILTQEAKRLGIQISHHTLYQLYELHHEDLSLALSELQKFMIYSQKEITLMDIEALVYGMGVVDINTFIMKILEKKEYKEDLEQLLQQGEDEIKILIALTNALEELLKFNIYIRVHGVANPKEILGYIPPSFIVEKKAFLAMKIKPENFYKAFLILMQTQLEIKSKNCDKKSLLYATLLNLEKTL